MRAQRGGSLTARGRSARSARFITHLSRSRCALSAMHHSPLAVKILTLHLTEDAAGRQDARGPNRFIGRVPKSAAKTLTGKGQVRFPAHRSGEHGGQSHSVGALGRAVWTSQRSDTASHRRVRGVGDGARHVDPPERGDCDSDPSAPRRRRCWPSISGRFAGDGGRRRPDPADGQGPLAGL